MATSPIYSWPEPDNTDLVKNGALAIRTLGNAIDTTMATMTPKSLVDAKGDLIAATANDTPARLAVGNNGETLVADSSSTTGLRYTAGNPISNPVLNSAFQVWQRGTSFTTGYGSNGGYAADRWQMISGATTGRTYSRQLTGDTTNLPNIQYCLRAQRNSGDTQSGGSFYIQLAQNFETVNSIPYAGKTVTFSFYARAGANFSSASNLLNATLRMGTGTDQNAFWSGYTGQVDSGQNVTLTTTWQRFSFTVSVGSTITEMATGFQYTPVGTAGAADYFEVTGVQLDIGSVALPFRTYTGTIQGELAACQRYYYLQSSYATTGATTLVANGYYYSSTQYECVVNFPVTMRTAPTMVAATGTNYYNTREPSPAQISTLLFTRAASNTGLIYATVSGKTAGYALSLEIVNAAGSIAFNSEL